MKDPLLQQYTFEELQIEWLMHRIEEDPVMAFPERGERGIQFVTGDPVFDAWEAAAAKGERPDFESYIAEDDLETVKRWSKAVTAQALPGYFPDSEKERRALFDRPPVPVADLNDIVQPAADDDVDDLFTDGFDDDYTE